jgi:signal transduction histidine kinase
MLGITSRWWRAEPLVRAEIVATAWEIFSVLLFSSAVVPLAFTTPWPSAIFVGGLAASALVARRLTELGRRGYAIAAVLRTVSWLAAVTPLLSYEDLRLLIATCGFGLMAGGIRRAIYRRTLDPTTAQPSPVRMRADLRAALAENAMVAGIVGGHVMLLFSVAFLRTASQVVFRAWWEIIPALAILGTLGFTLGVRPTTDRVHAGLRMGPDGDAAELVAALEQAERIPQRLSFINFAVWMACIAIGVLYFQADQRWYWPDALNQLAFGALFAWGVSFYQRGWHEDAVAPIVARLRQWTGKSAARETVDLRRRMLAQFGGPLLFALALSLLAAVGLYRTMASDLALREDFNAITALGASFGMLVLAVGGVFMRAARQLSEPLSLLAHAADDVASGKLDAEVPPVIAPVEVVGLGRSIERMRQALAQTIAELKEERAGLEVRVAVRTSELSTALEELKQAQTALIQGERMALIGELVAGVAHEIYNPLNAISGSISALERVRAELCDMLDAYHAAEAHLPDGERRAIEARRAQLDLEGTFADLAGVVAVVQKATQRAVDIVGNLKSFSRAPTEPIPTDIHEGLRETLGLVGHRIRHGGIELVEDYGDLPRVVCRAGEINQVFMNLLTNAIHAVLERHGHGGGVIAVRTASDGEAASVSISDNGGGVPAELQKRVFDPFFTTKARGEGTGLGLSISTEIMRRHGGRLWVEADPALGGARFVCQLPFESARGGRASARGRLAVQPAAERP